MSYFKDQFDAPDCNKSAKEIMGELIHVIIWQHNGIVGGEELNAADVVIDDEIGDDLLKSVSEDIIHYLDERFFTHRYIVTAIYDGKLIDIFKHDDIGECYFKVVEWLAQSKFANADLTLYDTGPNGHVLHNDELYKKVLNRYKYRAEMEKYNSSGESLECDYTYAKSLDDAKGWLNYRYLDDAPYDGTTLEIHRIMDIRPYANYVWGERYEMMDGTVVEFRIIENQ